MNKLAKRAWFALALAGVLLLGMGVIVVRYFIDSPDWVTFQNSPHVYTDGVMNSGKIVDRGGTVHERQVLCRQCLAAPQHAAPARRP